MKTYKVKVNGKVYEVELEEVSESSEKIEAPKASSAPVSEGANVVKAPIAGKVLDVKVNVGDVVEIKAAKGSQVKNGDALIVLG